MTDFSRLIAGPAGQRETFEELVCQLARRQAPHPDARFRRIHGAGGDGGVEAVWVLPDNSEHGYQAKFHTKSGDVDWGAIDKSVTTALSIHPKLTKMYIAIACDLTGPVAGRGKSGWDHWKTREAKWVAEAKRKLGHPVEFIHWTASELGDLLNRREMRGLAEYWLGAFDLSAEWFKAQYDRTVLALDERFHPEDHVEVSASLVFDGLARNSAWKRRLKDAAESLLNRHISPTLPEAAGREAKAQIYELEQLLAAHAAVMGDAELEIFVPFDTKSWRERCDSIIRVAFEAREKLEGDRENLKQRQKAEWATASQKYTGGTLAPLISGSPFDYVINELRTLRDLAATLSTLLGGAPKHADDSRFLFLEGAAGSGKSHFLAAEVGKAIEAGAPCLFLLGTDFTQLSPIERQFEAHLSLPSASFDTFLAALSTKAEGIGKRSLIVIDAVNEGIGAALWRQRLMPFLSKIKDQPGLALCVSCRTEFVPYLLTDQAKAEATYGYIEGFSTFEEREQAARVYMDGRGIVRPAAPRLDPEFINPLFLRTTCNALRDEGEQQFPRGLRGTKKILEFFLQSTARHLGTDFDGSNDLIAPTQQAVLSLAGAMAANSQDYLDRSTASNLVNNAFSSFSPPLGRNWLDVLQKRGLLRLDPNPNYNPAKTLAVMPDVVRFSFQRFQDHLMVEALLQGVSSPTNLFGAGQPFEFLMNGDEVHWKWRGLYGALHIQVADRWSEELPDLLPYTFERAWEDDWAVQDAFVDSVRFRGQHAYSPRALELLNKLNRYDSDIIQLLLELAINEDHPWNAELIHRNLLSRKLANRDRLWTLSINEAQNEPGHPLNSIIDWSLGHGIKLASDEALRLAAIVTAWAGSSTSRYIRDLSTKALTCILIERPAIADQLIPSFEGCDDPYVMERMWAALYGATLRRPDNQLLTSFAGLAWRYLFADSKPPAALLLRDYGRGIVEVANNEGALPLGIDLTRCRPPYRSTRPRLDVNQAKLEAEAERLGADQILYSCYRGLADFGRYVVESRVERFTNAPLSKPRPIAKQEVFDRFLSEVIEHDAQADLLLTDLRAGLANYSLSLLLEQEEEAAAKAKIAQTKKLERLETKLIGHLSPANAERYTQEARPFLMGTGRRDWAVPGHDQYGPLDVKAAKLWVARRALSLGWTKDKFPFDRSYENDRANGSKIERIGKKFQRIAFSELLARLADNYWLAPEWGDPAKVYDTPLDTEFIRDTEVSILPRDLDRLMPLVVPALVIPDLPESKYSQWVNEAGVCEAKLDLALGNDLPENNWATLYRYASCDVDAAGKRSSVLQHPWKQTEFHFMQMLMVPAKLKADFVREAERCKADFHEFLPGDRVDGPFVGELGLRDVWKDPENLEITFRPASQTFSAVRLAMGFQWESHLDRGLRDGLSLHLPTPSLLSSLELMPHPTQLAAYVDAEGTPAIYAGREPHSQFLLMRRHLIQRYADANRLAPIWAVIGERLAWGAGQPPQGGIRSRFNGVLWLHGKQVRKKCWARPN